MAVDEGKQPPLPEPGSSNRETRLANSGRLRRNHVIRRANPGIWSERSGSSVSTASSGIRPTIERTFIWTFESSGQVEDVVEEAVLLVPERDSLATQIVECAGDVQEVLEELRRDVLVDAVLASQLEGDLHHLQAVEAHPGGPVGLRQVAAARQLGAAVEDADVVESEETALEDVVALAVLPIDPPREVQQELVEDALEERSVRGAPRLAARSRRRAARPRRGPAD